MPNLEDLWPQDTVSIPSNPFYDGVIRRIATSGVTISTKHGLIILSGRTPAILVSKGVVVHGVLVPRAAKESSPPVAPKPTVYQTLAPDDLSLALKPSVQ